MVPFVDALNTLLDSSINLTAREYKEWGDLQEQEILYPSNLMPLMKT